MPTLLSVEGFYITPVNRNSVSFWNLLSPAKTPVKGNRCCSDHTSLSAILFHFSRKKIKKADERKEPQPCLTSLDHFALGQICLHTVSWLGRKGWADSIQLEVTPNTAFGGSHAFHTEQLPLTARANWGDPSHQRGITITSIHWEGRETFKTDQLGSLTINHRIRFDTLDIKTWSYWKVGHNDKKLQDSYVSDNKETRYLGIY